MGLKKLVIIGLDIYFADSFILFQEKGFEIIVLRRDKNSPRFKDSTAPYAFKDNADLYTDLGFKIRSYGYEHFYENNFNFEDLQLDKNTLVLSGPNFEGDIPSLNEEMQNSTLYDLWLLKAVTDFIQDTNCGSLVVRFHNGDTGFGSEVMADLYAAALKDVDLLLFDNDLLRDMVMLSVPSLRTKPSQLLWLEGPLKRDVRKNRGHKIEFLSLGRFHCGSWLDLPILSLPIQATPALNKLKELPVKLQYKLAIANSLQRLMEDRKAFQSDLQGTVFGLSHLGDVFSGSNQQFYESKDFLLSAKGQTLASSYVSSKEMYYGFCNCPSKDVTYLMYGLIPIVPHTLHNVYRDLVDKRMAIKVETEEDLERIRKMSTAEVDMYRENIYANADYFTFDAGAEQLIVELYNSEIYIENSRSKRKSGSKVGNFDFYSLICNLLSRNEVRSSGLVRPLSPLMRKPENNFSSSRNLYTYYPWLDKWWVKLARKIFPKLVDTKLIFASGAFDVEYYFAKYPELLKKRREPIYGYVRKGAQEGRNPNDWFATKEYITKHPEIVGTGLNPFVHYLYVTRPAMDKKDI